LVEAADTIMVLNARIGAMENAALGIEPICDVCGEFYPDPSLSGMMDDGRCSDECRQEAALT
jgi:hypothetical protein